MRYSRSLETLRAHIRWIRPHKWFPADDPIATSVAKLCVLREDLYIEFLALAANEISLTLPNVPEGTSVPGLDDNGEEYRRVYFLRASLRTLSEVRGAVTQLWQNKNFRKLYETFDQKKYQELSGYIKRLEKNLKELKRIRNGLGGHVLAEAIITALNTMPYEEIGRFQTGPKIKDTHFGFAGTICAQVLLQDVPKDKRESHLIQITNLNNKTLEIISDILTAYVFHKGL